MAQVKQINSEIYVPMEYSPIEYNPLSTGEPLVILPYEEKIAGTTANDLKLMMERSMKCPEIRDHFKGNPVDYYKLIAEYQGKGDMDQDISKKKAMKYYQDDWTSLDRFLYEKECREKIQAKEKSINDSLSFRRRFVQDSLKKRDAFVKDSLNARQAFVRDSSFRVNFRKKGNYDYVEFNGPDGSPGLCYRNGKIIDGSTFNQYGLEEKVYKNGVMIHNFTYSDSYLVIHKKKSGRYTGESIEKYDSVERATYTYTIKSSGKDLEAVRFVNEQGSLVKSQEFSDGKLRSESLFDSSGNQIKELDYYQGEIVSEYTYVYYPNTKILKQQTYIYFPSSDSPQGTCTITDYYSDGTTKQIKEYLTHTNGSRVLRKSIIRKDGYDIVEYYDYNGEFERRETKFRY